MYRPIRNSAILFTSLVALLTPGLLQAQTQPQQRRDILQAVPAGALAAVEANDLLGALGLSMFDSDGVRQLIETVVEGNKAEIDFAAKVAELSFQVLRGQMAAAVYAPTTETGKAESVILVIADVGERLPAMLKMFEELSPRGLKTSDLKVGSLSLKLPSGDGEMRPAWGGADGYFVLAFTDGDGTAVKSALAKFGKPTDSLAASAAFKAARADLPPPPITQHVIAFADIESATKQPLANLADETPDADMARKIIKASRLEGFKSFYMQFGEGDAGGRSESLLRIDGARTGVLKLWDQQPLTREDLAIIPADAYWSSVTNLDLAALWLEAMRGTEEVNPDAAAAVQGMVGMTKAFLGFSLTEDLLPAFGDTWAFFDAPMNGGFSGLGTVMIVDAKDEKAIHGALARIVELLAPLAAEDKVTLKLKEATIGKTQVHYVAVLGMPSPFAPAWTFVGGRWVFGLLPQTVAAAAASMTSDGGPRMIDEASVKKALAALPKTIHGFGTYDRYSLTASIYPLVTYATAAMTSLSPKNADKLAMLPHVSTLLRGDRQCVSVSSIRPDGVLYQTVNGSAFGSISSMSIASVAMTTSILLPSLSRARELAKRSVSMSNLRQIAMGCHVYASENKDAFPPSLDALVEPGYITPDTLKSPRSEGSGGGDYVYLPGQKVSSDNAWASVLAYEKLVGNEGTAVAFLDGHVEWVKMDRLKPLMKETYKRLGKDLPAEFRD